MTHKRSTRGFFIFRAAGRFLNCLLALFCIYLLFSKPESACAQSTPVKLQRYISLTPATTEILFALGLSRQIVGVSALCNVPQEARQIEKVGTFSQVNFEKIITLKPDLVFCSGLEQNPIVEKLQGLKINVYVCDPENFEELFDCIKQIGSLTAKTAQADSLIKSMKTKIEMIRKKTALIQEKSRPRVYIEFWSDPIMTVGRRSFLNEIIHLAGGKNIFDDVLKSYFSPSFEQIIHRNPDLIFLTYMHAQDAPPEKILKQRIGWAGINAVRKNALFPDIDPDTLLRPGPRLINGLEKLYAVISKKYENFPIS